jgi:integration host factor subunit beta
LEQILTSRWGAICHDLGCGFRWEIPSVTKKEIVKTISDEIGLTQLKTKEIVQKTFDAIVETLVEEGRIELRNFGVFEVKQRAARKARNPRTGEKVFVGEKYVVTFKPGKEMEERVRQLQEKKLAREAAARDGAPARDGTAARDGAAPREPATAMPRASAAVGGESAAVG